MTYTKCFSVDSDSGGFDSLPTWEICTAMPHTCMQTIYVDTFKPNVPSVARAEKSLKYDRFPLLQMTAPALATALIPVFLHNPKAPCETCHEQLKLYTSVPVPAPMMTKLMKIAKAHISTASKIAPMIQIVEPYVQCLQEMGHHASVLIEGSNAVKLVLLFTTPSCHIL